VGKSGSVNAKSGFAENTSGNRGGKKAARLFWIGEGERGVDMTSCRRVEEGTGLNDMGLSGGAAPQALGGKTGEDGGGELGGGKREKGNQRRP